MKQTYQDNVYGSPIQFNLNSPLPLFNTLESLQGEGNGLKSNNSSLLEFSSVQRIHDISFSSASVSQAQNNNSNGGMPADACTPRDNVGPLPGFYPTAVGSYCVGNDPGMQLTMASSSPSNSYTTKSPPKPSSGLLPNPNSSISSNLLSTSRSTMLSTGADLLGCPVQQSRIQMQENAMESSVLFGMNSFDPISSTVLGQSGTCGADMFVSKCKNGEAGLISNALYNDVVQGPFMTRPGIPPQLPLVEPQQCLSYAYVSCNYAGQSGFLLPQGQQFAYPSTVQPVVFAPQLPLYVRTKGQSPPVVSSVVSSTVAEPNLNTMTSSTADSPETERAPRQEFPSSAVVDVKLALWTGGKPVMLTNNPQLIRPLWDVRRLTYLQLLNRVLKLPDQVVLINNAAECRSVVSEVLADARKGHEEMKQYSHDQKKFNIPEEAYLAHQKTIIMLQIVPCGDYFYCSSSQGLSESPPSKSVTPGCSVISSDVTGISESIGSDEGADRAEEEGRKDPNLFCKDQSSSESIPEAHENERDDSESSPITWKDTPGRQKIIFIFVTYKKVYIIDMLSMGRNGFIESDMQMLLTSEEVTKVIYDCRPEVKMVRQEYCCHITPVCDLQVMATLCLAPKSVFTISRKSVLERLKLVPAMRAELSALRAKPLKERIIGWNPYSENITPEEPHEASERMASEVSAKDKNGSEDMSAGAPIVPKKKSCVYPMLEDLESTTTELKMCIIAYYMMDYFEKKGRDIALNRIINLSYTKRKKGFRRDF